MDDAFLKLAMSLAEAKKILGFPPTSTPSPGDIKSAYRELALKNHPDRGGDLEAIKKLNVAKDILDGKARPTYDRRDPVRPSPSEPSSGGRGSTWTPPKENKISFDEAKTKANIPAGVEWLFVTPMQHGRGWSGGESSKSDNYFVAYGRTNDKHVFVVANHATRHDYFVGGTENSDIWTIKSWTYPIKGKEGTTPSWLYGKVVKALKDAGYNKRFNSKVLDAKDWKLNERLPTGSATSIKHWLVNSGQVTGDDAAVANRKHVIEIMVETSYYDPKPGYHPEPKSRSNFWDGEYRGDYYKLTLTINGRPFVLDKDDTQKFLKAGVGSKKLTKIIFGDHIYGKAKKQLTRLRAAKPILEWMTTRFDSLPKDAMDVLNAVLEQKKR